MACEYVRVEPADRHATITMNRPERRNALSLAQLALTGEPISAATATEWGLVDRVVPLAELDARMLELLALAARGSTLSSGIGEQGFCAQVQLDQPKARVPRDGGA
jgi:enoyl-CoA hydratase/carnithine racemase